MKAPTALSELAPGTETVDSRIVAVMRLVLAVSALLIVVIAPPEPVQLVGLTYAALSLYVVYSAALYTLAVRYPRVQNAVDRWAPWIDVAWYVVLIALSQGAGSIFFLGFFFAIQVASFRWGFASGIQVTLVSVVLSTVVGYLTRPAAEDFELNRFLIRPVYMLAIGYMMAYWGGFEIAYKRKLALLNEVSALSNPRFGIDRTVGALMGQLRAFYAADTCLLVWGDPAAGTYYLRRVEKSDPEAAARAGTIPADLGHMLLALPEGSAVVYNSKLRVQDWWRMGTSYRTYDVLTGTIMTAGRPESEAIAATLDTRAFVSVPVLFPREGPGRLYVTANRKGFDSTDADFLLQVVQHVTPVLENVRLVDRLAWDAAEEERRKIARDLHDSVVQPYIGLQMGLAALRQKAGASPGTDLGPSIDRLLRFTEDGIADLRGYVHGLKSGGEAEGDLLTALRRYTSRFAEATNIDVQVDSTAPVHLNGRLAAEVFQMVAEGLSNVRRHTNATQAAVRLSQQNGHLILRLENENLNGTDLSPFTPRSIGERATALGGNARVEQRDGSTTSVVVEIPL